MIRVLIADDSSTFRAVLRHILERETGIEVIGQAVDGEDAIRQVLLLRPDVVTMDVRMPRKDGLVAIEEIMARAPTPVVVVSAEAGPERQELAFQALASGAIEVLGKPSSTGSEDYDQQAAAIRLAVRAVAGLRLVTRRRPAGAAALASPGPALTPPPWIRPTPPPVGRPALATPRPVHPTRLLPIRAVGIAASTGGPPALARILARLPGDFAAPILVVQHIAHGFEGGLVRWLDRETPLRVKLAEHGEPLQAGTVYLAPPNRHLHPLAGTAFLGTAPPVRGFRPSANALFRGMANELGGQAVGLVLTGMGDDGTEGLEALRAAGGLTLAQGPATSVVFGMPREALERGAATEALELEEIAPRLVRLVQRPHVARS